MAAEAKRGAKVKNSVFSCALGVTCECFSTRIQCDVTIILPHQLNIYIFFIPVALQWLKFRLFNE